MLCFRKFLVAKKFMDKRGGGFQDFQSKNFCLTVPKHSVGESVSLSLFSGIEKVWIRGRRVSIFSAENFLFHSTKKIENGTLLCCVSENFLLRKIYG